MWIALIIVPFIVFRYVYSSDLRGIHPNLIDKYSLPIFFCLDGSNVISSSRINDNFCDCPDGSDEPATGACNNGVFWCANNGTDGYYIDSKKVNDGIVDCCDGSDETTFPPTLKMNCTSFFSSFVEQKKKDIKLLEKALGYRSGHSDKNVFHKHSSMKTLNEQKIHVLKVEVDALKTNESIWNAEWDEEDKKEKNFVSVRDDIVKEIEAEELRKKEELEKKEGKKNSEAQKNETKEEVKKVDVQKKETKQEKKELTPEQVLLRAEVYEKVSAAFYVRRAFASAGADNSTTGNTTKENITKWYDSLIEEWVLEADAKNSTGRKKEKKRKITRSDNPHTKSMRDKNKRITDYRDEIDQGDRFVDGKNGDFEACLYESWRKKHVSVSSTSLYTSWEIEVGGTATVRPKEAYRGSATGKFAQYDRVTQTLVYNSSSTAPPVLRLALACPLVYTAHPMDLSALEDKEKAEEESRRRGDKLDFIADVSGNGERQYTATYYTPCACTEAWLEMLGTALEAFEAHSPRRSNVLVGRPLPMPPPQTLF